MRRTIIRALIILVSSAVIGLAVNAIRPDVDKNGSPHRLPLRRPPDPVLEIKNQISLRDAESLWNSGIAIFLDARAPADYEAGHIALAHNLPAEEFDKYYPEIAGLLTPDSQLVIYCDGVECDLSRDLRDQLERLNHANARVLVNGWTAWRSANLPTTSGEQP